MDQADVQSFRAQVTVRHLADVVGGHGVDLSIIMIVEVVTAQDGLEVAELAGQTFDGVFDGRLSDPIGTLPVRTVLRRQGDRVNGVYSYGVGQGEISGIVQGDTMIFVWQSGGSRGRGRVRTAPGGVEFDGTWGYGEASSGGGLWTGARRGR